MKLFHIVYAWLALLSSFDDSTEWRQWSFAEPLPPRGKVLKIPRRCTQLVTDTITLNTRLVFINLEVLYCWHG